MLRRLRKILACSLSCGSVFVQFKGKRNYQLAQKVIRIIVPLSIVIR